MPSLAQSRITGKERDPETGLDYFGARYYGSNMGRFMTPDWAAKPTAVPYAQFGDPQSLNLYGYVRNNPLSKADPDGHLGCGFLWLRKCPDPPPLPVAPPPSTNTPPGPPPAVTPVRQPTAPGTQTRTPVPTFTPLIAGAGLPPAANGALNAAKQAANGYPPVTPPPATQPPVPNQQLPDPNKMSPERELLKNAVDEAVQAIAGVANGATEVSVPMPVFIPREIYDPMGAQRDRGNGADPYLL